MKRTKEEFKKLWKQFANIPIHRTEDFIEKPFLHFEIGTDKWEIWKWFEEQGALMHKSDEDNLIFENK